MKLTSLALLCLLFLAALTHSALARRGGMGGGGKSSSNRGSGTTSNRGGSTNSGKKSTKTTQSQAGSYPKQPDSNQARSGTNQWGYPQLGRSPASPYQPQAGGFGQGVQGGHINYNPNNRILSPGYRGSLGHSGYGGAGGSPFARSAQDMGINPSFRSPGFGRQAVVASSSGVVTGMALGYGLGRFPRPPSNFHFRSHEEQCYYNHYMYRHYGAHSTDSNDYSRDYVYRPAPVSFANRMDECMQSPDLLPSETKRGKKRPAAAVAPDATPAPGSPTAIPTSPALPSARENSTISNTSGSDGDDDDETVSIMEIGYPALIEQMKTRKCVELYMEYNRQFLKKRPDSGARGKESGLQTVLAVVVSTLLWLVSRK